jgi:glycosyltransferase involved in cell wall biosynthesis
MTRSVLVIASFPESLVTFRGELISKLLDKGCVVHVAAPGLTADKETEETLRLKGCIIHNVPMRRTGMNPLMDFVTFLSIYRLARKTKVDITLAYTIKPVVYGCLAAWLAKVPKRYALITGLGYAFNQGGRQSIAQRIGRWLYRVSLARASGVIFQNQDDRKLFRSEGIIMPSTPTSVVGGSGVDTSHFSFVPGTHSAGFLLIARLLGAKGVREYAQAAKKLRKRWPEAHFRLIGWIDPGPDAILQKELDDWVDSGTLDFLGRQRDVRPYLAESAVYVLPSYREGLPRTVLEAMSVGRPVITSDAPGCRETIEHGVSGYLVPVGSVDSLVKAMEFYLLNPDRALEMGLNARRRVELYFEVSRVNQAILYHLGLAEQEVYSASR